MKTFHKESFRTGPLSRLLWAWKALPPQTLRKRLADRLWAFLYGDESEADGVLG